MDTKKLFFLSDTEIISKTLHSITYKANGSDSIYVVLGENDKVTFEIITDIAYSFQVLNTPDDYVAIKGSEIIVNQVGHRFNLKLEHPVSSVTLKKEGDGISLYSGCEFLFSFFAINYSLSLSFGVITEGSSTVTLNVF